MVRVPLAFRGFALLLLAASTAVGQTPEPPAELPLEPFTPSSPDFLRQYSSDARHPLLQLMVDGDLVSNDAALPAEPSPRLKPLAEKKETDKSASPAPAATETAPLFEEGCCPLEIDCPSAPVCLPFACPSCQPPLPSPCHCHKCKRKRRHGDDCGYGNPYLAWPCPMYGYAGCCGAPPSPNQGRCGHKFFHKHRRGSENACPYGGGYCGYDGGYAGYGNDGGFMEGCWGGCGAFMPPPPSPYCSHKRHRKHNCGRQGCGYGYGSPWGGYAQGFGYGAGCMEGCCGGCSPYIAPPPPPPCHCRKCMRKHGCSHGRGYVGCGYPGWPAYPVPGANMVDSGFNSFTDPNCYAGCGNCGCCGKHRRHCFSRCHRNHCGRVPAYPYAAYPMMPCMMQAQPCCMDCCGFDGFDGCGCFEGGCIAPAPSGGISK